MKKIILFILLFSAQSIFCMEQGQVNISRRNSSPLSSPRVFVSTPTDKTVIAKRIPDERQLSEAPKKTVYTELKQKSTALSQDDARPKI